MTRGFRRWLGAVLLFGTALPTLAGDQANTLLTGDARLGKKITQPAVVMGTGRVFSIVGQKTAVRLYAQEAELQDARLVLGCNQASAAAVMDATAALWLARWEKDPRRSYKLIVSEMEGNAHLPKTRFERDRVGPARDFARELDRLPPDLKRALLGGATVPAAALPPALLGPIRQLTESINAQQAEKGDTNPFPLQALGQSTVRVEVQNRGTYRSYFLSLGLKNWGSMGWRFNDDPRAQPAAPRGASGVGRSVEDRSEEPNVYTPRKFEIRQKDALKLPALQRKVSLRLKNATFPLVLAELNRRYAVSFVSGTERTMPQRADVDLQDISLGEALDELTRLFRETEWEYRKSGFLIIRGPTNPARKVQPAAEGS